MCEKKRVKEHMKNKYRKKCLMNKNKNIKIIKNNIEKIRPTKKKQKMKDYQKEYRKNIADEQKQKYKKARNDYNVTDEQK